MINITTIKTAFQYPQYALVLTLVVSTFLGCGTGANPNHVYVPKPQIELSKSLSSPVYISARLNENETWVPEKILDIDNENRVWAMGGIVDCEDSIEGDENDLNKCSQDFIITKTIEVMALPTMGL